YGRQGPHWRGADDLAPALVEASPANDGELPAAGVGRDRRGGGRRRGGRRRDAAAPGLGRPLRPQAGTRRPGPRHLRAPKRGQRALAPRSRRVLPPYPHEGAGRGPAPSSGRTVTVTFPPGEPEDLVRMRVHVDGIHHGDARESAEGGWGYA